MVRPGRNLSRVGAVGSRPKIADAVVEGRSLATEQEFVGEKIVTDEDGEGAIDEHVPEEYTQYLDPKYAEQLMSESLATSTAEPDTPPRKGPGSEAPVEEVGGSSGSEH